MADGYCDGQVSAFRRGAALGAVAIVAMKLLWLLVRQIEALSQVSPVVR